MRISDTISLWCPIPSAIHPHWPKWERNTVAWAERLGLDNEQKEIGQLRAIVAGELAGRTIFAADTPPGAQFSTDSLMWLFAFDDAYCDEGRHSHDPGATAILAAAMIRTAEIGRPCTPGPLANALADLRQRLDDLATPTQIARWVDAMKGYLGYQVWESAFRGTDAMPTLDDYVVARIRSGSMEVCVITLDIAEGYEVPASDVHRAEVRALTEMTCSLVGWDNDIASYHKERLRSKDRINLIDVIAHTESVEIDLALDHAVALRDALQQRFLQLRQEVLPLVDEPGRRYVAGLTAWIRGNLDWSMHTARYRRDGLPTIKITDHPSDLVWPGSPPSGIRWWWTICLDGNRNQIAI